MHGLPVAGAWAMIVLAALLIIAALFIGWDGLKAYQKYSATPAAPKPATVSA
jgi:DNA-binding transcriptional regulator of glucitol operon